MQLALLKGDQIDAEALQEIDRVYRELEARAREDLTSEGFSDESITLERYAEARYRNQYHDLVVPVAAGEVTDQTVAGLTAAFHAAHEKAYTYALEDSIVDLVHVRVTAFGHVTSPEPQKATMGDSDPAAAQKSEREVYFDAAGQFQSTPVYDADLLRPGMQIARPAIVERATTTLVVFPEQRLEVNEYGTFKVRTLTAVDGSKGQGSTGSPVNRGADLVSTSSL